MQLVQPLPTGGHVVAVRSGSTVSYQTKTDAMNGGDATQQGTLEDRGKDLIKVFGDASRSSSQNAGAGT
jgi:hypothetical protein